MCLRTGAYAAPSPGANIRVPREKWTLFHLKTWRLQMSSACKLRRLGKLLKDAKARGIVLTRKVQRRVTEVVRPLAPWIRKIGFATRLANVTVSEFNEWREYVRYLLASEYQLTDTARKCLATCVRHYGRRGLKAAARCMVGILRIYFVWCRPDTWVNTGLEWFGIFEYLLSGHSSTLSWQDEELSAMTTYAALLRRIEEEEARQVVHSTTIVDVSIVDLLEPGNSLVDEMKAAVTQRSIKRRIGIDTMGPDVSEIPSHLAMERPRSVKSSLPWVTGDEVFGIVNPIDAQASRQFYQAQQMGGRTFVPSEPCMYCNRVMYTAGRRPWFWRSCEGCDDDRPRDPNGSLT